MRFGFKTALVGKKFYSLETSPFNKFRDDGWMSHLPSGTETEWELSTDQRLTGYENGNTKRYTLVTNKIKQQAYPFIIIMLLGLGWLGILLMYPLIVNITGTFGSSNSGAMPWRKKLAQTSPNGWSGDQRTEKKKRRLLLSVLSDIFLHLIKMIIAPLVLAVLITHAKVGGFQKRGANQDQNADLLYHSNAYPWVGTGQYFEPWQSYVVRKKPDTHAETGIKANVQSSKSFIDHVIPESLIRSMASNDILVWVSRFLVWRLLRWAKR